MNQSTFGVAITADDKTAKGVSSAEKRIGKIPKHVSSVNQSQARAVRDSITRNSRGILRTIGSVEQASARVFGGRSITSGFASRLGAVREAASATGTGLGEAAASGGLLSTSLGAVGVVAGAAVGILASAGYAAFKLADGWAKGAASIGHTAEIIGVATKEMQEFAAASERMGVDKGTATSGIGGLSQTLNDARYGRNRDALAVLAKMGVKLQTNQDGTVNVAAMLPAIADAVARQNSSGRRTAVRALGMSDALIPVLAQGGKALSDDMADAEKTAYIATPGDIKRGQRIARKGAMVGQLADRGMAIAGSAAADVAEPGYDMTLSAGRQMLGGATSFGGVVKNTFAPAAGMIDRGGRAISRAADTLSATASGVRAAGRFTAGQIAAMARKAIPLAHEARKYFPSDAEAIGVASNVMLESGGRHRAREKGGNGVGLIQWTDKRRKQLFRQVTGVDVEHASREQQWRFARWETQNSEASGWRRAKARGQDPGAIAAGYAKYVERPANKERDGAERAALAEAIALNLHVTGLPAGAMVRAKAGRGPAPAVSLAMAR